MPEKEAMRFAKNLSYYVGQTGKSRKEICSDLGIQYSTFSEWLHGRKYPRITKISLLADYFGIRIADLIEEKVSIPNINKDLILHRILHSKELTALEKRYIENLIKMDGHARWFEGDFGDLICSRCGCGYYGDPKPACPDCGAIMDGGDDHVGQNA